MNWKITSSGLLFTFLMMLFQPLHAQIENIEWVTCSGGGFANKYPHEIALVMRTTYI